MRIVDENMEIFISDLKPEIQHFVLQAFDSYPTDKNRREFNECKPLVTIPIGDMPLEESTRLVQK